MFCSKCGNQSNDGAAFCQKCGEKFIVDNSAQQTVVASQKVVQKPDHEVKKKKPLLLMIVLAVVVLFVVVAIFNSDDNNGATSINIIKNTPKPQDQLIGKWELVDGGDNVEFKSDGTYLFDFQIESEIGKWSIVDNGKLRLDEETGETYNFTYTINGDTLTMNNEVINDESVYKKVSNVENDSYASTTTKSQKESQKNDRERLLSAPRLSYQEVARYPNKYKGQPIQIYGKVNQIIPGSGNSIIMQIHTKKDDYFDIYLGDVFSVEYTRTPNEARIIEDDIVRVYGTFTGIEEYDTVLGTTDSVPSISAKIIER